MAYSHDRNLFFLVSVNFNGPFLFLFGEGEFDEI